MEEGGVIAGKKGNAALNCFLANLRQHRLGWVG